MWDMHEIRIEIMFRVNEKRVLSYEIKSLTVKGLLLETLDTQERASISTIQCIVTRHSFSTTTPLFPVQGQTTRFTKVVGLGLTAGRRIAEPLPKR